MSERTQILADLDAATCHEEWLRAYNQAQASTVFSDAEKAIMNDAASNSLGVPWHQRVIQVSMALPVTRDG